MSGSERLSFLDAFSGYNHTLLFEPDQEHIVFITDHGFYCYMAMPFGLKNASAMYQKVVNTVSVDHISRQIEVYIENMIIKMLESKNHIQDMQDVFDSLLKYKMKLNLMKFSFERTFDKFLGYLITQKGLEANLYRIWAIIDMLPPANKKKFSI